MRDSPGVQRVLLVVRFPIGGIRTHLKYVYPLVHRELPDLEITLVTPRTDQSEALERDLSSVPIKYVYLNAACTPRMLAGSVHRELAGGRFTLAHSHGFTAATATALVAKLHRVPHLTTVHDVLLDRQFAGARGLARKRGMKFLLGRIDCLLAVSEDVKKNLTSHFGPGFARRVQVVRNGILTRPVLEARPRDLRAELGLGTETLLIGFFGRFMGQKGFRYLVEAIGSLRERPGEGRFHVAAFGGGGFVREERAAIEQAGLMPAFSFFPFEPDVAGALKSVDVVVIPSLWEASSLLGMEAMVAGVPVIGTDCIGLSEVLAGTPARIVPAGDGRALADALTQEALSSSRAAAQAFIPLAAERFDVAARIPELIGVMNQVAARARATSR
jgi:glycosyltransferase involved in cell wall biosynthesis